MRKWRGSCWRTLSAKQWEQATWRSELSICFRSKRFHFGAFGSFGPILCCKIYDCIVYFDNVDITEHAAAAAPFRAHSPGPGAHRLAPNGQDLHSSALVSWLWLCVP